MYIIKDASAKTRLFNILNLINDYCSNAHKFNCISHRAWLILWNLDLIKSNYFTSVNINFFNCVSYLWRIWRFIAILTWFCAKTLMVLYIYFPPYGNTIHLADLQKSRIANCDTAFSTSKANLYSIMNILYYRFT